MESFDQLTFPPLTEQENISLSSSLDEFWNAQNIDSFLNLGEQQVPTTTSQLNELNATQQIDAQIWSTFNLSAIDLQQLNSQLTADVDSAEASPVSSPSSDSDSKESLATSPVQIKLEQVDQLLSYNTQLPPIAASAEDGVGPVRHSKRNTRGVKDESKGTASITLLSREQLLQMTSDELEDYVKMLAAARPLSSSEKKEFKRFRRLVKNRESAQQSRRRKRDRIDELEIKMAGLSGTHNKLQTQMNDLIAENTILRAEVNQLVSVIKDSPVLSSMLMNITSLIVLCSMAHQVPTSTANNFPSLINPTPAVYVC